MEVADGSVYRSIWTVGSTVDNPDIAVNFRLRANQRGTWSAWDRYVISEFQHAPSAGNNKNYDVFFNPVVGAKQDEYMVFSFDIMSFDWRDDTLSYIFLDQLEIDEVNVSAGTELVRYEFDTGVEGWLFEGAVITFDEPTSAVLPGKLGLSPDGSSNCFSYFWSPDIPIEDGQAYRVFWEVESSVTDPDMAVDFRLRANQRKAWQAWNRNVTSRLGIAPSSGNIKTYDVILIPEVKPTFDEDQLVINFDIISFDWCNDMDSWLYMHAAEVREVELIR